MSTLLDAARRAVNYAEKWGELPESLRADLRAAIAEAEKAPAGVSAEEVHALIWKHCDIESRQAVGVATAIAALVAERTEQAVDAAHRAAVRLTADVFTKTQAVAVEAARAEAEAERLRGCGHCEATFAALEGEQRPGEGHVETVIRLRAEVERLRAWEAKAHRAMEGAWDALRAALAKKP